MMEILDIDWHRDISMIVSASEPTQYVLYSDSPTPVKFTSFKAAAKRLVLDHMRRRQPSSIIDSSYRLVDLEHQVEFMQAMVAELFAERQERILFSRS